MHLEPDRSQITRKILAARPPKNSVDPVRPYHYLVESELASNGVVEDVATVFLTNRECPCKCLMCDLWRNTLDHTVPMGAIPAQIDFALDRLPVARHLKLYNSGNFFDAKAIPPGDWEAIAERARRFDTLIVENHPRLCDRRCAEFAALLGTTQLEIALGLETSHAPTLARLNKQMTTDDFAGACDLLRSQSFSIRSFVLLRPPETTEEEGIERAIESVRFALDCGVGCIAVIPTRAGNGILDEMQKFGQFEPPQLCSLEKVLDETVSWQRGRVFADLWDAEQFASCSHCATQRMHRLQRMNTTQSVPPRVSCELCGL